MSAASSELDVESLMTLPLTAHLASDGPRQWPVWFQWEDGSAWLMGIGRGADALAPEPGGSCVLGVVDFDAKAGVLRHVAMQGSADIVAVDHMRLSRLLVRYLGPNKRRWNDWFGAAALTMPETMVRLTPASVTANSFSPPAGTGRVRPGARGRAV